QVANAAQTWRREGRQSSLTWCSAARGAPAHRCTTRTPAQRPGIAIRIEETDGRIGPVVSPGIEGVVAADIDAARLNEGSSGTTGSCGKAWVRSLELPVLGIEWLPVGTGLEGPNAVVGPAT